MKNEWTHLDLFSGIGGFALAARWAFGETHKVAAFVERDSFCQKVLAKHWPDAPIHDDIHTFDGTSHAGTIDLLTGGFPCQPFSTAGQRGGKSDDRYLWPEMLCVIEESQPRWIVGENVAGLINMAEPLGVAQVESRTIVRRTEEDIFTSILTRQEALLVESIFQDLERAGYEVQPFVIPACAVNAGHRRDRLWIVAHSNYAGQREQRRGFTVEQERTAAQRSGDASTHADGGDFQRHQGRVLRQQQRRTAADRREDLRQSDGAHGANLLGTDQDDTTDSDDQRELQPQGCKRDERRRAGNGSVANVANANNERLQSGRRWEEIAGSASFGQAENNGHSITQSGADVRDSASERLPNWSSGEMGQPFPLTEFERPSGREIERNFCGVAYGVSRRVDRLRSLGNAVVPQVAYEILRAIKQVDIR